jgi:hypothetical protein
MAVSVGPFRDRENLSREIRDYSDRFRTTVTSRR